MYIGVKLINYPHLYYFSHFAQFTLYLRKCEKYQILFNFVLISKFSISIMETTTLFPRRLEKHKFLLRSRVSMPKATWCLKRHGSLYLPVKIINLVHN